MSYEFGFAKGKTKKDGPVRVIMESDKYKILDFQKPLLSVNEAGYDWLNEITENMFFKFIKGEGYNQRYVRLKPQRKILDSLKLFVPKMKNIQNGGGQRRITTLFEEFIGHCENMIKEHDEEALLIIY